MKSIVDNLQSYLVVRHVQVSLEGMWEDDVHVRMCYSVLLLGQRCTISTVT